MCRQCFPGHVSEDVENADVAELEGNYLTNPVGRRCRDCGAVFRTYLKQTGSKWANLCSHCLAQHT